MILTSLLDHCTTCFIKHDCCICFIVCVCHNIIKKAQIIYNPRYQISVCCCVCVSGSACSGQVGRMLTGKSHVIVSTVTGSAFFHSVPFEPDKLAVGVAFTSSLEATRLIRNSKWSCHFTLTKRVEQMIINQV